MQRVPDWWIQSLWWLSGIFATGAGWYFLSTKEYPFAISSAALALLFAVGAIVLHRRKDQIAESQVPLQLSDELPDNYVRRQTDEENQVRILHTLPDMKRIVYESSAKGWDTGNTIDACEATYDALDFLEFAWVRVAEFYPRKHWDGMDAEQHVKKFIRERYKYHWAKNEPGGPGTGGTIVRVITGGDVMKDLEMKVEEAVSALFMWPDSFDYKVWQNRWRGMPSSDTNDA
jgi:hypothetical protein